MCLCAFGDETNDLGLVEVSAYDPRAYPPWWYAWVRVATMSLATDVYEQIRRYMRGTLVADDLSDWLDEQAQQTHDAGDADLRELTDLTHSLLEDVFADQRSDAEARAALQHAIPGWAVSTPATSSSLYTATPGDSSLIASPSSS